MHKVLEKAYAGNLGFEELMRFYQTATEKQTAELEKVLDREDWPAFKHLMHKVLGVNLESRETTVSKAKEFLSESGSLDDNEKFKSFMLKVEDVIEKDKPYIIGKVKKYFEVMYE